jgi:hypothetical protein
VGEPRQRGRRVAREEIDVVDLRRLEGVDEEPELAEVAERGGPRRGADLLPGEPGPERRDLARTEPPPAPLLRERRRRALEAAVGRIVVEAAGRQRHLVQRHEAAVGAGGVADEEVDAEARRERDRLAADVEVAPRDRRDRQRDPEQEPRSAPRAAQRRDAPPAPREQRELGRHERERCGRRSHEQADEEAGPASLGPDGRRSSAPSAIISRRRARSRRRVRTRVVKTICGQSSAKSSPRRDRSDAELARGEHQAQRTARTSTA